MIPASVQAKITGTLGLSELGVTVIDETRLRTQVIDQLIQTAVFGTEPEKITARWLIWETAQTLGIHPSSIHSLYVARGRGATSANWTVPAINLRGLTYDMAQAVFAAGKAVGSNGFILELARGEMGYTDQSPAEFTSAVLAGAIKQNYTGPVFLQGDHFQTKSTTQAGVPDPGEVAAVDKLIKSAIEAGFYNIDIDASTLVDLTAPTLEAQQAANITHTARFLGLIRQLEPAGITISVGGEIGHIGGKNSTPAEFEVFMQGLSQQQPEMPLISKISLATGTEHGGKVNPDGSLAELSVDFDLIRTVSQAARARYQMGGAVQHGASTLADTELPKFPAMEAVEIHLSTGFQNLIFDHPAFPAQLKQTMYQWLDTTQSQDRSPDMTPQQFYYKARKKCWGQFKPQLWQLAQPTKDEIRQSLAQRVQFIFEQLAITQVQALVEEHTPVQEVHKEMVDFDTDRLTQVEGLAD